MPLFSCFTPFGALAFSSAPSLVQKIYDANIANLNSEPNENFDVTVGTNIETMIYARSRVQAASRYALMRAYNNAEPARSTDTIPTHEKEYQVVPGPNDDLTARRAVLAARALLPNGATYVNVSNALLALLGSGFKFYRVTTPAESVDFPATAGASPGNFVLPATIIKHFLITSIVSVGLGAPQIVTYSEFEAGTPDLVNGDILTVDGAIYGETERITVSAVTASAFTATFTKAHGPNTFATTAPYPFWHSTARHAHIIVTRAVAEDEDKRRQINELLARMLRGVSTWSIEPDNASSTASAQYLIGDAVLGRVGYAAINATAYP
jgi:hypothetical protein